MPDRIVEPAPVKKPLPEPAPKKPVEPAPDKKPIPPLSPIPPGKQPLKG